MVKTTVYLDPDTAIKLRQLAIRKGSSQAELIRSALNDLVRKNRRPLPVGVGRFRSGRSDIGQRAEELLREAARNRRWD